MIGRLHGIVIDCEDPDALATFYESLLSMRRVQDEGDWVVIGDAPDRPGIAFAGFRTTGLRPGPMVSARNTVISMSGSMTSSSPKRRCSNSAPPRCRVAAKRSGSMPILQDIRSAWWSCRPAAEMRLVAQRAARADVRVSGNVVGAIDRTGLVLLVGVTHDDTPEIAARMAEKVWRLRIFEGEQSAEQLKAPMLVVVNSRCTPTPGRAVVHRGTRGTARGQRTAGLDLRGSAPRAGRGGGDRSLRRRHAGVAGQRRTSHADPGLRPLIGASLSSRRPTPHRSPRRCHAPRPRSGRPSRREPGSAASRCRRPRRSGSGRSPR